MATGKQYGNAVNWVYSMDVPVGKRTVRLKFDDWLWSMDKKVAFNRSYLKKFGFIGCGNYFISPATIKSFFKTFYSGSVQWGNK